MYISVILDIGKLDLFERILKMDNTVLDIPEHKDKMILMNVQRKEPVVLLKDVIPERRSKIGLWKRIIT